MILLLSMRLPIAVMLPATLMAWRAYEIAPVYSVVQAEMAGWIALGSPLLAVSLFWEMIRWYQRMDRRHLPKR